MNNYPFVSDIAIENYGDDELGRKFFSSQLKDSLSKWDKKDSLIVALRGSWGEGKTSVLNLVKKEFEISADENTPTIIEFNPWAYSHKNNISFQFYKNIADNLEYRSKSEKDRKIAKQLTLWVDLMNLSSEKKVFKNLGSSFILLLGIGGLAGNQLLNYLNNDKSILNYILIIGSFGLVVFEIVRIALGKVKTFFDYKSGESNNSSQKLKSELCEELKNRDKKLLVIIDDIDRLTTDEIFEVFKLIKLNGDFPNTIYLLAYDNKIITTKLDKENNTTGIEYLKKIIQIEYDLPFVNRNKIHAYLYKQLNIIVSRLPNSGNRFFGENNNAYWSNSFHSGYKDFFKNIRDVKRYFNSLLFNINFLIKGDSYEVNPVDFFCLEAIRVFTPELYQYIKSRKVLFTDIVNSDDILGLLGKKPIEQRKIELEFAIGIVEEQYRDSVRKLLLFLFPQIESSLDGNGKNNFLNHITSRWSVEMRICSNSFFDAYFSLIPGGNEGELTQYDIDKFIKSTGNRGILKNLLDGFILDKKIHYFLTRIQDFTEDLKLCDYSSKLHIITTLFDILDRLINVKNGNNSAMDLEIARIIYQLLESEDTTGNLTLLNNSIRKTTGVYGPVYFVASLSTEGAESVIPKTKLRTLQRFVIKKANFNKPEVILLNHYFLFILYRFKEWVPEKQFNQFINSIKRENSLFLQFCRYFVSETKMSVPGQLTVKKQKGFNLNELSNFVSINEVKDHIELIQEGKGILNKEFKEVIMLISDAIDIYTKNHPDKRLLLLK